jgi:hypothetical protein
MSAAFFLFLALDLLCGNFTSVLPPFSSWETGSEVILP